jgi:hypothetical protein
LPLFTGTSSETLRKVPDRIQIDTTLIRQNRIQNHTFIGRHRLLNRTAVIKFFNCLLRSRILMIRIAGRGLAKRRDFALIFSSPVNHDALGENDGTGNLDRADRR